MNVTLLHGYPDYVGKRFIWAGYGIGPSSYSQTTGDAFVVPGFQYQIDTVQSGGLSVSGTYFVRAKPSLGGARATWVLKWYVTSTNAEVANAVDLSAETVQFGGFGGRY